MTNKNSNILFKTLTIFWGKQHRCFSDTCRTGEHCYDFEYLFSLRTILYACLQVVVMRMSLHEISIDIAGTQS